MSDSSPDRILGVDPGSLATGIGIVEAKGSKLKLIHTDTIKTNSKQPFADRLKTIHEGVQAVIEQFDPTALSLEDIFFATNAKSTIKLGQTRGVILLAGAQSNVAIHEYTPLEVKQSIVGYGRADKKQVQAMVMQLLGLKSKPGSLDASDALAVAICHLNNFSTKKKLQQAGA
ncbi:MAG: crossover junction endodeoxyribonuclease RuvC [Candidatus Nitronauta litoralis]|uniref:Crossover junction endodeoxyribonuclease RuvC n=1 Tax=Candidatus Nitronauta litoralis TaxID=2705533 RepID=A0A7T0FYM1_9BACT|nr:MAG: crossover junction endodeoxyribonuclease RuvC [Candidatus Nitronauta litoralis]